MREVPDTGMIRPAMPTLTRKPTSARESIARGVLASSSEDRLELAIPGTDYLVYLLPTHPATSAVGKRIAGTVRVQARRVDVVRTGGRFIEPVIGSPRRIQGTVIAIGGEDRAITVKAVVPVVCRLTDARQKPEEFSVGDLVSFDVLPGATFTPEG